MIAALAEGVLAREEIARLREHIEECPACRQELKLASLTLAEEAGGDAVVREAKPNRWWLGVATLVLVPLGAWIWQSRSRTPIEMLAEAAPRSARVVEPRLSGGFRWAPYRGVERGSDAAADVQRLKLGGAAGSVIDEAQRDPSAAAQHAAGVAYVLIERPDEAIARLRRAAEASPNEAKIWSDLAAAQFVAALQQEQPSRLTPALASADRALSIDPRNAEALFNRALILGRMGVADAGHAAWERYLAIDATSGWAGEAREHLRELPRSP